MRAIIMIRLEKGGGFYYWSVMIAKRFPKNRLKKAIFGCLFGIMGLLFGVFGVASNATPAYAVPNESNITTEVEVTEENTESNPEEENDVEDETDADADSLVTTSEGGRSCKESLGAIGWVVCPTTGKIAEAIDFLYDKIETILVINPVEMKDGTPIYEIWKYARGITNIVFVIFLLVVVISQLTGYGITNYGIKKALPKLIVTAILVNLSFVVCLLAVDFSNVIGSSLRGVFTAVEEATIGTANIAGGVKMSSVYGAFADGTILAVGAGVIAVETGAIWMLIPTVLGAITAVVIGLVTIAMRQAVVALLIMVSPLAIVAYMLPNTEQWFKKWKQLLIRMLVFYPMFSLLFGASSLAGWAIIASSGDTFGLILGIAVQIFPLFFAWSLMKMSGTVLGTINSKLTGFMAKPLSMNRSWAESRRQATNARFLSANNVYTPSLKLRQYLSDRKIAREEETREYNEVIKNRGLAYGAMRNYRDKDGKVLSREGEETYRNIIRNIRYGRIVNRHKDNMQEGVGDLSGGNVARKARLDALDREMIRESDLAAAEVARGEDIQYRNAMGRHKRYEDAINSHFDRENEGRTDYRRHEIADREAAERRYEEVFKLMNGNEQTVQYAAASAAQAYDTQKKIVENKMQKYFELTPPTRDVEYRLAELTKKADPAKNIDAIIAGLRILNQRGDTDLLRLQLENVLESEKGVQLGTHASQAIASFLMFEVKDNDPFLRRFGKYINLETAQTYNKNKRQNANLSLEEYITGEYEDWDYGNPEHKFMRKSKRPMKVLVEGTSLDNVERTAYGNLDQMLIKTYTKNGVFDEEAYLAKRKEIETSIGPQFISASLKYLSGSEQLKNAVSFLTGYDAEKGPRWENSEDPLYHSKAAEAHFREKTMKYIQDQTPSQILGLRSDYRDALFNHLVSEYENTKMEDWSDEAILEREELIKEEAEIQTRYGDLPPEQAKAEREKDMAALRKKMAGAQFRQLLDAKGKLNQIYRTRRSGAANNAKDWVREWLDLDNEVVITQKLENDRKKLKDEYVKAKTDKKSTEGDTATEEEPRAEVYDEVKRNEFVGHIDDLWQDFRDDDEGFYDESLKYIEEQLGKESYIAEQYRRYRRDDPYADNYVLREYLKELLRDPESY